MQLERVRQQHLYVPCALGHRSDVQGWAQSPGSLALKARAQPSPVTCLPFSHLASTILSSSIVFNPTCLSNASAAPHFLAPPLPPSPPLSLSTLISLLTGLGRPLSALHLQVPPTPHPSSLHRHWRANPATTQTANDDEGGHWRRQQHGDDNNTVMTATVTERHA
ncbi:hypothetical protein EDB85DRAFT_2162457 [Lactarius pseudohatsudake]|nr:hypothetical protein EDB85DRAFT_2162457 [Lactarius pseudohatsudake]